MDELNYDSPFVSDLRKLIDFVALGLLWLAASLPIVTAGAATAAMFYTAENQVHTQNGDIWKTFWRVFRRDFRQATLLWMIGLLLTAMLGLNALLLWKVTLNAVVYILLLAAVVFGIGWMQLWYSYLSRFNDSVGAVLINTFRIALASFPKLLLLMAICAAAIAVAVFAFFHVFPVMILVPGFYIGLSGMVQRWIFKPYLPQAEDGQE